MLAVADMPGPPLRLPPSRELRGVAGGAGHFWGSPVPFDKDYGAEGTCTGPCHGPGAPPHCGVNASNNMG